MSNKVTIAIREMSRVLTAEEAADCAVFSGGCRTVRQPKVEELSSGEGVDYCVEFCSNVKRGQIFEVEDEAEDNLSRPRTSSRPEKVISK